MEEIKPSPRILRLFFFWSGIIATFAYRIIIVLNFYNPLWVKISWYIGTIGFIVYFWHRYQIDKKKSGLVTKYNLMEIIEKINYQDEKQKQALNYLVRTSQTSKSKWNSFFIFGLSGLALIVGIVMDLL